MNTVPADGWSVIKQESLIAWVEDVLEESSLFSGTPLPLTKGKGAVVLDSRGAIYELTLDKDETLVIDPSILVASNVPFAREVGYPLQRIRRWSSLKTKFHELLDKMLYIIQRKTNSSEFWSAGGAWTLALRRNLFRRKQHPFLELKGPGKLLLTSQ